MIVDSVSLQIQFHQHFLKYATGSKLEDEFSCSINIREFVLEPVDYVYWPV